ncbi:MAG: HAD-IA family hydrolase [Mariprofundaceae bacterium]|nr:HAD-IA family hydrolase [Mariprofundaceae bacterium]
MTELKCILWDVDGTLADTERDGHRVAFNKAFEEAGLERRWDVETYGELLTVTGGKERMKFDIKRGGLPDMPDEEIAKLHARKTIHYQTLIADGLIPLRKGVLRLLEEAYAEGITLGISTTTTPAALDALIEHSLGKEWFDRFAVLAAGDIVAAKKPAPDIYNYALEQLGIPAENTLALEDSGNGCLSALAAHIKCVITINDYTAQQKFEGADLIVSELGEPESDAIQVLGNPHALDDVHHVTLAHLKAIMGA